MNLCSNVPKDELKETARIVQEVMANAYPLSIPLSTEARYGANWGETNQYKNEPNIGAETWPQIILIMEQPTRDRWGVQTCRRASPYVIIIIMPGREDIFQKSMNEGHSAAWDQEWGKAAAAYRKALQEMPDNPKALNSLGLALFQQANYEEALQIYKRAAQVSPQDPSPMEKLAQLLERTGHLKEAIDAASKAAELFLNQRDVDKAIENWVRVTMLDPDHVMAHSRLALAHERLGHKTRAVAEFIAVASLVQRTGNLQKTAELVKKACRSCLKVRKHTRHLICCGQGNCFRSHCGPKVGQDRSRWHRSSSWISPRRKPIQGWTRSREARQKALTRLAEILFEYSTDDGQSAQARRGLQALMRGTGQLVHAAIRADEGCPASRSGDRRADQG